MTSGDIPARRQRRGSAQDSADATQLRAEQLDGAARLLAGIGLPFDLLAPEELRPILAAHAEALLTAAHP